MHARGGPAANQSEELELLRRALDAFDVAVMVFSADLQTRVYANAAAMPLCAKWPSPVIIDAIDNYILSRGNSRRVPPALRVQIDDHAYYVRVVPSAGTVPLEVAFLRQEILRDVDVLRVLEQRFGVSRREYQIISSVRVGKTNRQIATDLGLAEGTVARHVHRILERVGVRNRTELVHLVDELVKHTG